MKKRFSPKFSIKKGDSVAIIAGNDKDLSKARKVIAVYPQKSRVLVEGANMVTKHLKPNAQNPQGGRVQMEAPIHISNVMLWDSKSNAPTRISLKRENGKSIRISKKSGQAI